MMYFDGEKNKKRKKIDFKKVEKMPEIKKKPVKKIGGKPMEKPISTKAEGTMRLNRYIAHCGICSRRKADDYIKEGKVKVNNKVVMEPGTLWTTGDIVVLEGKKIESQKFVYILLNKPKNTISTNSDEKGRKLFSILFRIR